jgi:hypothetical protein
MPLSDDLGRKYAAFNMRLCQLRAINSKATAYGPHTANKTVQVIELLHKAKTLEREYREWFNSLPTSFSSSLAWVDYGVEDTDLSTVMSYPGKVETYKELYVAYLYNIARSSQILIWYTILRCVAWLFGDKDYKISPEYNEASRQCRELIKGIISSMPYFFIWDSGDIADGIQERLQAHCENASMKGSSATFLMWPLYIVANSDFATASQRIFARGKLTFVAHHVGINQASLMLQVSSLLTRSMLYFQVHC